MLTRRRKPLKRKPPRRRFLDQERDFAYLEWIRSLPCLVCAKEGRQQESHTHAHHAGPRAFGRKAPDRCALPLCGFAHHEFGPHAVHVLGRCFWEFHGLDMAAEIARLNREYLEQLDDRRL